MKIMKTFNLTTTIVAVIGFFQPDGVHGNTMRVTSFVTGEQRTQSAEKVVNGSTVFRGSTSLKRKLVTNGKKNTVVHAPTSPPSSPSGNCKHVTVKAYCDVTSDDGNFDTGWLDNCVTHNRFHCLKDATVKYDVCVDGDEISDYIFSLITHDMNNVRDYFDFKLTLNGMEQEIDDSAFSLPWNGSKGVCLQYNIVLDGCTTPLDFTAGVKLFPAGRIDSQEPCDGNDPFQAQQSLSERQGRISYDAAYHTLAFPVGVYDKTAATSGTYVENLDSIIRGDGSDGSSSKIGTTYHTVADAGESDVLLETPADSGGRFFSTGINNHHAVVDSITRGDGSSSKTSTMHPTVADAAIPDVSLETLSVDGGGRFSPSGISDYHAVVDAINDDDEILPFTGTDGGDVFAQRKLIKSSKKVKHPKAMCTISLFADSLFLYANKCFNDIMVTISPCDDKDDMCYISEHLPSLPQEELEEQENQEEEQCFVGGSFPAKENIQYNPSTGDCEFLYVDLTDDPCNLYTDDTGTGSLGLKARINVKNNPDMMFIQFTKDKGLTFYNYDDERVADRFIDRSLRQEGATKPVLSMIPRPFASGHRRLYYKVALKNDTPYKANSARIEYCACDNDENDYIASGGTWTATYRGACWVTQIWSTLIIDGREQKCMTYISEPGTGLSKFYIILIDGKCCVRSSYELGDFYVDGGLFNCDERGPLHPTPPPGFFTE